MAVQATLIKDDWIREILEEMEAGQPARNESAIRLLEEWLGGGEKDEQEQRETWEYLKQALDEDRPAYRKLFP